MNNALIQALLSGGAGGLMGMLGGQGVGGAVPPTGPGRPMPLNPGMMPPRVMPSMPAQPWGLHPMPIPNIPGALPRPMPSIPWGQSGQPLNPRIMPPWGQSGQPQPAIPNMPNMPWGKPMPMPMPMPARPDMPGIPWGKPMPMPALPYGNHPLSRGAGALPYGKGKLQGAGNLGTGALWDYINRIMQSNPNTGQPQY
jgi:hypothetical protein